MTPPLIINFDYGPTSPKFDGITHLMKIYQGAPYDQKFSVQASSGLVVRDFSGYSSIRMQLRLNHTSPVLLELSSELGHIIGTTTELQIAFPAALTAGLSLPTNSVSEINQVRFIHDIELSMGGVVVERLAQGIGYIVAGVTV